MQQWSDFEKSINVAERAEMERRAESVTCKKCNSQWFEQVEVSEFVADHHVVVGQKVPERPSTIPYIVLRCIRCESLVAPRVLHATRDIAAGSFDSFLDTLEDKGDTRKAKMSLEEPDYDKAKPPTINLLGVDFNQEELVAMKTLLNKPAKKKKSETVDDAVPGKE
jgi:hypothetical protein